MTREIRHVVYKYRLIVGIEQVVKLPKDASILCVQMQHGKIVLWAKVDSDPSVTEDVKFEVYGTGHVMSPYPKAYVGTVQDEGGFVWHCWMRLKTFGT